MEIYLSESVIRKLIRQELYEVLEDKNIKTNTISDQEAAAKIKNSSNKLKKLAVGGAAATALTIALGLGQDESQAAIENVQNTEIAYKVEKKIEELEKFGLQYNAAEQIVAGVIQGVNEENKMPEDIDSKEALDKQTEIYKLQSQELDELDQDQVKTILYVKFYKDMEAQGNKTSVSATTREKKLGALKTPLDAMSIGIGAEVQDTITNPKYENQNFKTEKTPEGLVILTVNPIDLKEYWEGTFVEGSTLENELRNEFGNISIPYFHYTYAAGEKITSDIEKQTMRENKILIIRGKYV